MAPTMRPGGNGRPGAGEPSFAPGNQPMRNGAANRNGLAQDRDFGARPEPSFGAGPGHADDFGAESDEDYTSDADFGDFEGYGDQAPGQDRDASFGYDEREVQDFRAPAPVPAAKRETVSVYGEPERKRRGGGLVAAGWTVLLLFLLIVVGAFFAMPDRVKESLPGAGQIYNALGMGVEPRTLAFENVRYLWTSYQGQKMLQVEGDIVNLSEEQMQLPNVLIALLNEGGELIPPEWMAPAGEEPLEPGASSHFATQIPSPPPEMKSFRVSFQQAE